MVMSHGDMETAVALYLSVNDQESASIHSAPSASGISSAVARQRVIFESSRNSKSQQSLVQQPDAKRARQEEIGRSSRQRPRPGVIAQLLAHPVYSLASQINADHFEALARRRAVSGRALHWHALLMSIHPPQRLAVVCRGHLSALLVQKLIRFRSERAVKRALKHAIAVLSRRHFVGLKDRAATCVSTLRGHSNSVRYSGFVNSVAFHPSAPYLATGSSDNTAKLWLLNADCSAATCVSTLQGHSRGHVSWGGSVNSVAFHPSALYLATGSNDDAVKLWR